MSTDQEVRKQALDEIRREAEQFVQERVLAKNILQLGERLEFVIRIVSGQIVAGAVADTPALRPPALPKTKKNPNRNGFSCSGYELSKDDWALIEALPWVSRDRALIEFFRDGNNGPFHKSTIRGIWNFDSEFFSPRVFNKKLREIDREEDPQEAVYSLHAIPGKSGWYAFWKIWRE